MIDLTHVRPLPGAEPIAAPPEAAIAGRRRCAQCHGPFGLIRRRRSGRQFCCAPCMEAHDDAVRSAVQAKARWLDFLDRARAGRGR
jgi:hypothetical protein